MSVGMGVGWAWDRQVWRSVEGLNTRGIGGVVIDLRVIEFECGYFNRRMYG